MSGTLAIGIRIDKKLFERVEKVGHAENLDRSTAMRILLEEGYASYSKRKAAEEYKSGKITFSEAARKANNTIWEFEQYLVQNGFKSQYSVSDMQEELKKIK
jgi:metal-responsive CopG/Arc/MetJ family transcriptional regulator